MPGRNSFSGAVPLGGPRRQPGVAKFDPEAGVIELSKLTLGVYGALQELIQIGREQADSVGIIAMKLAGDMPHLPAVGPLEDGGWGVFCLGCTQSENVYTYPCKLTPDDPQMPPARLVDAPEFCETVPTEGAPDG
jgi:hypothetical protein